MNELVEILQRFDREKAMRYYNKNVLTPITTASKHSLFSYNNFSSEEQDFLVNKVNEDNILPFFSLCLIPYYIFQLSIIEKNPNEENEELVCFLSSETKKHLLGKHNWILDYITVGPIDAETEEKKKLDTNQKAIEYFNQLILQMTTEVVINS